MLTLGAVAIGRNEGDRLKRCLSALVEFKVPNLVYVDSGSIDDSVAFAERLGVAVVNLDMSQPFTAARARNAGFEALLAAAPDTELVQFLDGDCELIDGWLEAAEAFLRANGDYAMVCGRLKERHPDASVYNFLCDQEWNTPVGDAKACGGNTMVRASAFQAVDGFNPLLIAGEEPELCVRLRQKGWRMRRLDQAMAYHDADMHHFSQWWQRSKRAGYAFAEGAAMHGAPPESHWVKERNRALAWGLGLPLAAVALAPVTLGASITTAAAIYPTNWLRMAWKLKKDGRARPLSEATFLSLGKFAEARGALEYYRRRLRNEEATLIEYKGSKTPESLGPKPSPFGQFL